MYVETVPNRNSPPAILLREGWREGKRVRKRTIANLSDWPQAKIDTLRRLLKDEPLLSPTDAFDIIRSKPHGHVAAVLGTLRKLGLDRMLSARPCPERERVVALIAARVMGPASKLATARALAEATARDSLAETLGLGETSEDQLYAAMDWLLERQEEVEKHLAQRHLGDGALVLYDLTSVYLEGRCCPLARHGHSRDGKRGKLQIEFGLLCDREGRPVAVEVFEGNTADPRTLGPQVDKLRRRFGLSKVVLVGDRGMLTEARIREEVAPAGLDWISALRSSAIRQLVESGAVQMSLFDHTDLVEIRSDAYPGERLVVCRNPLLATERARKREELLRATERLLDPIVAATEREKRPLTGREHIALRVGRGMGKYKMAKHFHLHITDHSFRYTRNPDSIAREAALDGLYIVRTSLPPSDLDAPGTVTAYKSLSRVERAFRCLKTVDLKVRPVHHHAPHRVRAHVLLCMLAYYVEWHMRRSLAPLLFDDHDPASAQRSSSVARQQPLPPLKKRLAPSTPMTAPPSTASAPCSTTSPPLPKTASPLACLALRPSTSSPVPPRCKAKPSISSVSPSNVPSSRSTLSSFSHYINRLARPRSQTSG